MSVENPQVEPMGEAVSTKSILLGPMGIIKTGNLWENVGFSGILHVNRENGDRD